MDAHADIDENTLKDEGVLRCPKNGHVLYMQVANSAHNNHDTIKEETKQRMGPTVIFPNRTVAWGSVTPRTLGASSPSSASNRVKEYIVDVENYWDDAQKQQFGYEEDESSIEEMAIVPAINGRLLRFDGAAFHSVPKPPDRYLLSEKELRAFTEEDSDAYKDEKKDDKGGEDKEDSSNQRSVILFNTWSEGSSGPRGVTPDRIVDDVSDDYDGGNGSREEEKWNQWRDAYGMHFEKVTCNPIEKWRAVDVAHFSDGASRRDVTISLMGNPSRRGCTLTKAEFNGAVDSGSFYDGHQVSLVTLESG